MTRTRSQRNGTTTLFAALEVPVGKVVPDHTAVAQADARQGDDDSATVAPAVCHHRVATHEAGAMAGQCFADVLEGARRGNEDAFRSLFRSVQPGLLRYLGVFAGPSAEDIAAETWVSVVRNLGRFAGDEPGFSAWVFTIARARLRDEQRRVYRRPTPVGGERFLGQPADSADPADHALEAAGTAAAVALLAVLPPDQAEVVLLRHVVGLDVAQTARILDKRPGAVRVASHRGLVRLRAALGDEAHTPAGRAVTNSGLPTIGAVT